MSCTKAAGGLGLLWLQKSQQGLDGSQHGEGAPCQRANDGEPYFLGRIIWTESNFKSPIIICNVIVLIINRY